MRCRTVIITLTFVVCLVIRNGILDRSQAEWPKTSGGNSPFGNSLITKFNVTWKSNLEHSQRVLSQRAHPHMFVYVLYTKFYHSCWELVCWPSHEALRSGLEVTHYQDRTHSLNKSNRRQTSLPSTIFHSYSNVFSLLSTKHHISKTPNKPLAFTLRQDTRVTNYLFFFFFLTWASFSLAWREFPLSNPLFTSKFDVQWDLKISGLAEESINGKKQYYLPLWSDQVNVNPRNTCEIPLPF